MSGILYGVVTIDPISGKPSGIQADVDMTLPDAAVIADSIGGLVVSAPRGPWAPVAQEDVAEALQAQKDEAVDVELRNMIEKEQQRE